MTNYAVYVCIGTCDIIPKVYQQSVGFTISNGNVVITRLSIYITIGHHLNHHNIESNLKWIGQSLHCGTLTEVMVSVLKA